jgi:hypothetical protein
VSSKKLLVKVKGDGARLRTAMRTNFGVAPSDVVPIFTMANTTPSPGMVPTSASTWLRFDAPDAVSCDAAHELFRRIGDATEIELIEPDIEQQWGWTVDLPVDGMAAAPRADHEQDTTGGQAAGPRIAWNLDADFSQLKQARARVGNKQARVRIAHLDTGFDPGHVTLPQNLLRELQANFADDRRRGTVAVVVSIGPRATGRGVGGQIAGVLPEAGQNNVVHERPRRGDAPCL